MQDIKRLVYSGKYPDICCSDCLLREAPNGDWIVAMLSGGYTEPRKENSIYLCRSKNKGITWDKPEKISLKVKQALIPTEIIVEQDKMTMYVSAHDGGLMKWKSCYCVSCDSGYTWSPLENVPLRGERTFIRNLCVLSNGKWLLPYQHYILTEKKKKKRISDYKFTTIFENGTLISDDQGETWTISQQPVIVNDVAEGAFIWHENNVAELSDKSIAMLIRVDGSGFLYRSDSLDEGRSWSKPRKTDIPNPGAKFRLFNLSDGRIVLLHNPNNEKTPAAIVNKMWRNPISVWISDDDMKSWAYKKDLSYFPGQLQYPDGFIDEKEDYLHFALDYNRHDVIYIGAKLTSDK